jgi:hypothetical protein
MSRNARSLAAIMAASFFALAVSSATPLTAQGRGRGRGHEKKAEKNERKAEKSGERGPVAVAIDRDGHVRVIREYAHAGSLPPGLAKRQSLPPGLLKQLRERGTLPPGLEKRWVPVPAPLAIRLPPVPPYYHRYFAGDDLLIVDTRTNRIAAIIHDVWR